jgi:uncharacterized membrane protein (DUF4010 family)
MAPSSYPITGLCVALGIGLLIGVERERAKGAGPDRAAGGVRTFTLLGLLGALGHLIGDYGVLVAGVFVAMAVVVGYQRTRNADPGLTTEVAMVVTFALGVLAMRNAPIAAGMGVVVAVVLAAKSRMHRFSQQLLTAQEMHDLLLLAACAFVVLPLLPDRSIDPWGAINPHRLWLLVVAVMGVSSVAYVAMRALGARLGLALAGLAGGFVSGTATVAAMGDGARANPASTAAYASAGLLANVATIIQMVVVLATLSPELLRLAAWPLLAAGIAVAGSALLASWRAFSSSSDTHDVASRRPFEPRRAIGFVLILTVVLLFAAIMRDWLGNSSLPWILGLSGFADVHAAAASAAQLVATGQVKPAVALTSILAALTANSLGKCLFAAFRGGWPYARRVVPGIVLMMIAFAATMQFHTAT